MLITLVVERSPADEAGLRAGDVVVAIEGKQVRGLQHFKARLAAAAAGEPIGLDIWRRGQRISMQVVPIPASELERRLSGQGVPIITIPAWGLQCTVGPNKRPLVTSVRPETAAARAGISNSDVIVGLDLGEGWIPVRSLEGLRRIPMGAMAVGVAVWRDGVSATSPCNGNSPGFGIVKRPDFARRSKRTVSASGSLTAPPSKIANGRVVSSPSKAMRIIIVSGTDNSMPTGPKAQPQKNIDKITTNGERPRRCPMIRGSSRSRCRR